MIWFQSFLVEWCLGLGKHVTSLLYANVADLEEVLFSYWFCNLYYKI